MPITKNHEFKRVYNKGASASGQNLVVYCRRWRDRDKNRLGLTVSTKVGKAVQRNKIRRRLKEICLLYTSNPAEESGSESSDGDRDDT